MHYFVRYASRAGLVEEEVVEAQSEAQASQLVSSSGRVVLAVRGARVPRTARSNGLQLDVPWWCRELSTLLRSGMTAVEAIDTLALIGQNDTRGQVVAALQRRLQEGQSLSQAMRGSALFPAVLVAGVTASERTSTLPDALDDYLRYHDLIEKLRRQAIGAAIYPALVLGLGVLIVVFLLLFVMPRFARLYGDLRGDLSFSTQIALWLSSAVLGHSWLVVSATVGIAMALFLAAKHRGGLFLELIERFAPFRRRWDEFRLAKLYQSLAMLFRGGYTLEEALEVGMQLDLGARLLASVAHARSKVTEGQSASVAFASAGLTNKVTERLLAAGERSGSFDGVLQTVSARHATSFATFVERMMRVAEPLLLLVVALVVGGVVVMMYMPIFDMAGSIGGGR
jgi:general secretion pathway protein F